MRNCNQRVSCTWQRFADTTVLDWVNETHWRLSKMLVMTQGGLVYPSQQQQHAHPEDISFSFSDGWRRYMQHGWMVMSCWHTAKQNDRASWVPDQQAASCMPPAGHPNLIEHLSQSLSIAATAAAAASHVIFATRVYWVVRLLAFSCITRYVW